MSRFHRSTARILGFSVAALLLGAGVQAVEIPFHPERGLVEVDVLIDGHVKGRFGIDTGADRLYIDGNFARANHLSEAGGPPPRQAVGVDGSSDVSWVELRSLELGREQLYNLRAATIDLPAMIKDTTEGYPDGLIGYELLRRFYVTVDYPNETMTLQMEEPEILSTHDYVSVPFEVKRHFILVNTVFNDSVETPMVLDYCASYTIITPDLAARLGIAAEAGSRAVINSIRLGDNLVSDDVTVIVRDMKNLKDAAPRIRFDGLLGASFLYQHKITIAYKRDEIILHQP